MQTFSYKNLFTLEKKTGLGALLSLGEGQISSPVYIIVNQYGQIMHKGKRKHVLAVFNTRYNMNHNSFGYQRPNYSHT